MTPGLDDILQAIKARISHDDGDTRHDDSWPLATKGEAKFLVAEAELHRWRPIETCPPGYEDGRFHHVLFKGYSKSGSFYGDAVVSGWMDTHRRPVHFYSYKLTLTHWMEIP